MIPGWKLSSPGGPQAGDALSTGCHRAAGDVYNGFLGSLDFAAECRCRYRVSAEMYPTVAIAIRMRLAFCANDASQERVGANQSTGMHLSETGSLWKLGERRNERAPEARQNVGAGKGV